MRVIKFRAKSLHTGEWLYGNIQVPTNEGVPYFMWDCDHNQMEVIRETVGQFTGLYDKNGKEIYEGDIIASEGYSQARHYIRYLDDEAMFIAMIIHSSLQEWCYIRQSWIDKFEKRVIGNIFDDADLIMEKEHENNKI